MSKGKPCGLTLNKFLLRFIPHIRPVPNRFTTNAKRKFLKNPIHNWELVFFSSSFFTNFEFYEILLKTSSELRHLNKYSPLTTGERRLPLGPSTA